MKQPKPIAVVFSAPVDEAFELANAEQRLYRKELVYEGLFKGQGGQKISVPRWQIDRWASVGTELIQLGFKPPLPLEHTFDPEKNRGEVQGYSVGLDSKGRYALFGIVKFSDAEAERLASRTNVSIYAPAAFTYAGKTFTQPITHVALTNYPVVPQLDAFETIAASYVGDISMAFDFSPLAKELGIPEDVELDENNATGILLMAIRNLKGEKPKPTETEEEGSEEGSEKPPIAASNPVVCALLRDNRRMKLDELQRQGRLTKPAREQIEKRFFADNAIALSATGVDDGFDSMITILAANPPCVPMKERTGTQAVALSHSADAGNNGGKSRLELNAEKRAAKRSR